MIILIDVRRKKVEKEKITSHMNIARKCALHIEGNRNVKYIAKREPIKYHFGQRFSAMMPTRASTFAIASCAVSHCCHCFRSQFFLFEADFKELKWYFTETIHNQT